MLAYTINGTVVVLAVAAVILMAVLIPMAIIKAKKIIITETISSDPLTGGLSERAFFDKAAEVLKGKADSFAVVSMRVENMPRVCVSFGPSQLEATIIRVHEILRQQLSDEEVCASLGEDAFAFLLKNRKSDEICARLERIANAVNADDTDDDSSYQLDLGFGIYLPESREYLPVHMLGKAIQARLGGNGRHYRFYDRRLWDVTAMEREMAESMDHALHINEFVVYYQPKVRMQDQRVAGAEALIRWRHPRQGLLSSEMFLPLAERYQKIWKIDLFVFETVCATLARWKKQGRELFPISMNVAEADLNLANYVDDRYEICSKFGVDTALIEFEMKENLLLTNPERATSLIQRLHDLGFRCAVDNFGADAIAMQLLNTLDIDTVKLDASFFGGENDNRRGRYVAEAILKLTNQLHIQTVAEGVANASQAQFLQQAACDMIQGFYYFKPMPLEKFESEVWEQSLLKFVEPAVAGTQKTHRPATHNLQDNKSIVMFSYMPQEDRVEFSQAFSPIMAGQTKFHNALAFFRTTELIHENDRDEFFRLLERCQREDGWLENTLRFYVAQGRYGWLEMHLYHSSSDAGSIISGTMINIAEWQNEVNRWKEKATRDALTGLYNREHFEHSVQTQLEQRNFTTAAVLFVDVDDFKRVNDTFGHMFGDDVLCYVAKQLLGAFHHSDVVARYGGDEFVVFAPSITRKTLEERLQHLYEVFRFPYRGETVEYKVSLTIGAAVAPEDGTDYDTLLEHADCATYEAKSRGKGQYVLYEPYMKGEPED